MNRLRILFFSLLIFCCQIAQAQNAASDFPEFIQVKIPGAPVLGKPILATSQTGNPLITEGFGLAAPAFYDWDGDGLKDLLVGEFGSGAEHGVVVGNFIRVYLNIGTEDKPVFSDKFDYARPPYEYRAEAQGTPYSVDQFCCMAFAPQFFDLNRDGFLDMISGQYYGDVSFFQGSDKGFRAGIQLPQKGNPREKMTFASQDYWSYSAATFGDLDGDGKADLILGGALLRWSKNIGTEQNPEFSTREALLDTKGNPLKIYNYSAEELTELGKISWPLPAVSGDYKLSPYAVDWDNDGVLDLLVTNSYHHEGLGAIDFFRGVKVNGEQRFETGVHLIQAAGKQKALPGAAPRVFVTDWNNDGVKDLLVGMSVVTLDGKFSKDYSWSFEKQMGLLGTAKDPGYQKARNPEENVNWLLKGVVFPAGVTKEIFLTMRHQGYVYVLLGSKN